MVGWIFFFGCVTLVVLYRRTLVAARRQLLEADTCARCGYIVHGLPRPVCPECGSDLRAPRTVWRRGSSATSRLRWSAVAGIMALAAAYWYVADVTLERAPRVGVLSASRDLLDPPSGAFRSVRIDYAGELYERAPISGAGRITITTNDKTSVELEVNPVTWAYRTVNGPAAIEGIGFSPEVVRRWAQACGVSTATTRAAEEMATIEATLRQMSTNQLFLVSANPRSFPSGGGGSSFDERRTYPVMAAHALLAIAWIAASAWLVRRARVRSHTPAAASVL